MSPHKPEIVKQGSDSQSGELTPQLLRSFEGCDHYSDEQAEEICDGLRSLASVLLELYKK